MDEIEELLNPKSFLRANRQMIIHASGVGSFRSDVYGKLVVSLKPPLDCQVDISREKSQAFKNWIEPA